MKFWQELRRRRVFRMTGLYIVGAWVVIQVAEVSFEAWGVPDSALRFLFIAAFACFPVALVFSWFYDITAKGIVRTEKADVAESVDLRLKLKDYLLLAALLVIGGLILFGSVKQVQEQVEIDQAVPRQAEAPEHSLAVLPFSNLDINAETGYFSDGITEEILNQLSELKALHVLASNSSFAFRDSQEGPAGILQKLGVRYLLQGSIRRDQDYVRVTARLIDEKGFQVWSDQYDRQLQGIFAIQTEIASQVASQVINEIVPLKQLPEGRTTENMEAYNQYLAGKAYFDSRTPGWKEQAIAAFQEAINLDPGFAPPYAGLAMATTVNTGFGSHWEEARQLAEKSIELDDDYARGHAALGMILMAEGKLHESTLSSRRALELNPSLGFAYNILARALGWLKQTDEVREVQYQGLAVDPLNPPLVANIAGMESRDGNFERAEQLLLRLLSLPEPPSLAYFELHQLYDNWGLFADALNLAKQITRQALASGGSDNIGNNAALLAWSYANLGMQDDADYWMNQLFGDQVPGIQSLDFTFNLLRTRDSASNLGVKLQQLVDRTEFVPGQHHPWLLCQLGLVNIQRGNFEKGAEQLDLGLHFFQAGPGQTEPADSINLATFEAGTSDIVFVMHLLASAYQQIDQQDKASAILEALEDEFGMDTNALHQALKGNRTGAFEILNDAEQSPWKTYYGPGKYYEITSDPAWAGTIEYPEFQELLTRWKVDIDQQRAEVVAIEAENDFREEIQRLTKTETH